MVSDISEGCIINRSARPNGKWENDFRAKLYSCRDAVPIGSDLMSLSSGYAMHREARNPQLGYLAVP